MDSRSTDGDGSHTLRYRLHLRLTPQRREPGGGFRFDLLVEEARAETLPQVEPGRGRWRSTLDLLSGMGGFGVSSARGLSMQMAPRTGRMPDLQVGLLLKSAVESLKLLHSPLPMEAVGAGARWVVRDSYSFRKATVQRSRTYTLSSLDGSRGVLAAEIREEARDQEFDMPRMPKGGRATIDVLDASGSGTEEFDLSKFFTVRSQWTQEGTTHGKLLIPGALNKSLDSSVRVSAEIEPWVEGAGGG